MQEFELKMQGGVMCKGGVIAEFYGNTGAAKNNYKSQRCLQLELKNSPAGQRAPKLGKHVSAATRTVRCAVSNMVKFM